MPVVVVCDYFGNEKNISFLIRNEDAARGAGEVGDVAHR
jgi:hypothetical protein